MRNYPDNMYSNVYPDFDFTHDNHTYDNEVIVDIIKLGYGYYALQYATGRRERVTQELAQEIAQEMNMSIADFVN